MNETRTKPDDDEAAPSSETPPMCSCVSDPFAALPPELRPRPEPKKGGLRQATCPHCGLKYVTNRATDVCIACEKKGLK